MSLTPRVTVLLTVYNGLPYLRGAIESVLGQTFEDFEFLIVDDASTDGSVNFIRSNRDPRIRLFCNGSNLGQAQSLNRGMSEARGPFVARIDQDDICFPERLRKQVEFLEARPDVAVVGSWGYCVDSRGRKMDLWRGSVRDYGAFLARLLLAKNPLWHPTVMFRRDVVMEVGGYDTAFAPAEDFDLWVRLALGRHSGRTIREPLLMYRVHEGQQSIHKQELQLSKAQQAQLKLVKAFGSGERTELLAELLRLESSFWRNCESREELLAVLDSLAALLMRVKLTLKLTSEEFASLTGTIYRWMGAGARLGPRLACCPSLLFYPLFFALSPLLIPRIRPFLSRLRKRTRRLPYVARTFLASEPFK